MESMEKVNNIIYRVTSPSGKVYVGQTTKSLIDRQKSHILSSKNINSPKYNCKFYNALRKYDNLMIWEIIEDNISLENLNEREIYYIQLYDSFFNGYNATSGGENGRIVSEETKKRISENHSKHNLGTRLSEEQKQKISLSTKLAMQDIEIRQKISRSKKGKPSPKRGIPVSSEQKEKQRKKMLGKPGPMKGRKFSIESRLKMSIAQKNNPRSRNSETGKFI
jgi:hypothetical protein